VSIIAKRSDAGEAVFIERRRGMAVSGIVVAVLLTPGTFIFFLSPGKGGLRIGIVMAACSALGLLVAFVGTAREALQHRDRITVTSDAITFKRWSDGRETTFRRVDGDLLLIFPKDFLYASAIDFSLTQLGTGRQFGLYHFPRGAVRRACGRRGWRFGYDPGLGERHLRLWWDWSSEDWGWLMSAASIVVARGPINVATEPGGHVSLGAAILSGYAAGLPQSYQDYQRYRRAAKAYRLAADAQRSYAALATSPEENAARQAEADKLQAKAQSLKAARS
jgi:hypothetical protein